MFKSLFYLNISTKKKCHNIDSDIVQTFPKFFPVSFPNRELSLNSSFASNSTRISTGSIVSLEVAKPEAIAKLKTIDPRTNRFMYMKLCLYNGLIQLVSRKNYRLMRRKNMTAFQGQQFSKRLIEFHGNRLSPAVRRLRSLAVL